MKSYRVTIDHRIVKTLTLKFQFSLQDFNTNQMLQFTNTAWKNIIFIIFCYNLIFILRLWEDKNNLRLKKKSNNLRLSRIPPFHICTMVLYGGWGWKGRLSLMSLPSDPSRLSLRHSFFLSSCTFRFEASSFFCNTLGSVYDTLAAWTLDQTLVHWGSVACRVQCIQFPLVTAQIFVWLPPWDMPARQSLGPPTQKVQTSIAFLWLLLSPTPYWGSFFMG